MAEIPRIYVVECFVPRVDHAGVQSAVDRAAAETHQAGQGPSSVAYLGALLMAVDEVVLHAFRAADAGTVRRVSLAAGLAFERIVESVEVLPAPLIQPSTPRSATHPRPVSDAPGTCLLQAREVSL